MLRYENPDSPSPLTLEECQALYNGCTDAIAFAKSRTMAQIIRQNTNISSTVSPWR